jgi:hypothetical protein
VKKISAAILDYAAPVLDKLPPGEPLETRRATLEFAILVWNALVLADAGRRDFLVELRSRLGSLPGNDIVSGAFDRLIERRRERYADDDRLVGNWELRLKGDGSLAFRAEARRPAR